MTPEATETSAARRPDVVASLTLAVAAVLALALSWTLPWWTMEARAPQYGQRVLVVTVSPKGAAGDVFEIDALGHYVGIAPMASFAPVERKLAPPGICVLAALFLAIPFVRSRWLSFALAVPALAFVPVFFVDLDHWMKKSARDRDPEAALSHTVTEIDTKLIGAYEVGQFKVVGKIDGGAYLAALGALLGLGLAGATPLRRPRAPRNTTIPVAAAVALLALPGPAGAAERHVAPGDSLAAAVAAASSGDVLNLAPGVYRERVKLEKTLTLRGPREAVIDGGNESSLVWLRAPGCRLEGLTLRGTGDSYLTEDAAVRIEATDCAVVGTRVEECLFGLFLVQADRCSIERTTVVGKDLPHERRGDAIRLWYSHDCRLLDNAVDRSRDVIIWYSSGTRVEGNVVARSRYGLHYMYSDRNSFRRNRFEDDQVGAAIMYSRGIELTENAFSFSNGPSAHGLLLKDADDVFVVGNRFVGNSTALFIDNAPMSRDGRVDVRGNLIARNDVGIALQPLTRRVRFSENALIGNGSQVTVLGTGSADGNEWAAGGRGNYWSDAIVYDRDGDGVSDVPHRLESTYEALADRHPTLAFFAGTPASDAIDTASRLFPIFAPRPKLVDPRPLVAPKLTAWTESRDAAPPGRGVAALGAVFLVVSALGLSVARGRIS